MRRFNHFYCCPKPSVIPIVMNKVEVKRLITSCQDLNAKQQSLLRRLLDQNVIGVDSMTSDGTLISVPELLLVIADNITSSEEGK